MMMATTAVYRAGTAIRGTDVGIAVQDFSRLHFSPKGSGLQKGNGLKECCSCTLGAAAGKGGSGFELKCHVGITSQQIESPTSKVCATLKQAELSRDQLVLPSAAAHPLEIALHQLRLLPENLDLAIEQQDNERSDRKSSLFSDESPGVSSSESSARGKNAWTGIRRQKRMPTLPPWTEDDFRQREKLILEAILAEQNEQRVLVVDVLDSWVGKITRVELTNLMKAFGYMKQVDLALDILYWMQKQKGRLKPNRHVYSTILGVLGRGGMVSKARELFDSEVVRGLNSVIIYNAMMGAYVKSGLFKRAWKLYEELCERGLEADEVTFNTLFSGISKSDMPIQMAEKLFSKMKKSGVLAGRFTYNTLIMLYSKAGNFKAASKMLDEMRSADHLPDLCTFNTIIGMHARAGQHEEAVQVFSTLKEVGLKADTVTYTNLIQMFNQAHMWNEAVECFSEMLEVGCKPDLMTYSLMVHVHGRAGRPKEAEQAIRQMQKSGFRPNVVTWSSLIQVYGRLGMLAELNSGFAEMQKSGCKPDATLYNIVMNAYAQASLPSQAACLFRKMLSQDIQPTAACYNTMIHAYAQVGQIEEARAVAQKMMRAGFGADKLSRRYLRHGTLPANRRKQNPSSPGRQMDTFLSPSFSKQPIYL
ncbi:hypothetical protein R1flu_019518 [Riccia fluitans]|uniref:Pentatricopeptide repeat-containing protein n=1 Tax=Riccia fluitans TaxID=41844 RepID=A0ABD1ZIW1_9MARC